MNSLKEVYANITHQDHVKVAQARPQQVQAAPTSIDGALLKQAQDYDSIGRILAHNVFGDMLKTALDESAPGASDEEKAKALALLLAAANGEKPAESEEDEDEAAADKDEATEKKAAAKKAVKKAIIAKMGKDPKYAAALVGKYTRQR